MGRGDWPLSAPGSCRGGMDSDSPRYLYNIPAHALVSSSINDKLFEYVEDEALCTVLWVYFFVWSTGVQGI